MSVEIICFSLRFGTNNRWLNWANRVCFTHFHIGQHICGCCLKPYHSLRHCLEFHEKKSKRDDKYSWTRSMGPGDEDRHFVLSYMFQGPVLITTQMNVLFWGIVIYVKNKNIQSCKCTRPLRRPPFKTVASRSGTFWVNYVTSVSRS